MWLSERFEGATGTEVGEMIPAAVGSSATTLICAITYGLGGTELKRDIVLRLESAAGPIFLDTDLRRQGEMMSALARSGIPTANVIGVEPDERVLGAPFMVMDRVSGRSLSRSNRDGWLFELEPAERGAVWRNSIDAMARINRLKWDGGFEALNNTRHLGQPGINQYINWLIAWHTEILAGDKHKLLDPAMDYLRAAKPGSGHVDVLWGDSNPGNFLFADDLSVAAVLDFEAAALGPAEVDLGWWLMMDERRCGEGGRLEGLPERDQMVAVYEESLGRRVDNLPYFEVLAAVRMTLVVIRTVQRLIGEGKLQATCGAGLGNPYCVMLANKLGLSEPGVGEDFQQFIQAVRS